MGLGDDLMITAHASEIKKKYPERQIIIGNIAKKQAYHSIIYENNPNIANCNNLDYSKPIHIIDYHPGNRPYINYEKTKKLNRYIWNNNFKPKAGQIFFSKEEKFKANQIFNSAKNYWKTKNKSNKFKAVIFLESSSTKLNDIQFGLKQQNLSWGHENWQKLVNKISNTYLIIQSCHKQTLKLDGVYVTDDLSFRLSSAVMNKCDLFLGAHGGFAHVAAALEKSAIIYFGGWAPPEILGYQTHKNIYFKNDSSPCGMFSKKCIHCEEARKKITPNLILKEIENLFSSK